MLIDLYHRVFVDEDSIEKNKRLDDLSRHFDDEENKEKGEKRSIEKEKMFVFHRRIFFEING